MKEILLAERLATSRAGLHDIAPMRVEGRLTGVRGLAVDVAGLSGLVSIGDCIALIDRDGTEIEAEIAGFHGGLAQAMPFAPAEGLGPGGRAQLRGQHRTLAIADSWLGRVIDPLGAPLDGRGRLPSGPVRRPVRAPPPLATARARLGPRLDFGVRALNLFATSRQGQRLGLFSGSGIGKSTLLAMLARQAVCDVAVLALVGERGREVREFLEDDLGPTGLARAVVVVATSDTPPMMRRQAAYAAMTVAEHFRDQGKSVLFMMDSVTRFCLALREIGLAAGEPPATRGYPPSVFAELPRLLERAGPGTEQPDGSAGHITALFTVLVEGDDHNEPVADAVRGTLDGHVVLDRRIAEAGRYPAVNVLRSLSRAVPGCNSDDENALTRRARSILALWNDVADLVRLGAYRAGSDPAIDEAVALAPRLEQMLRQAKHDRSDLADGFAALRAALQPA